VHCHIFSNGHQTIVKTARRHRLTDLSDRSLETSAVVLNDGWRNDDIA